MSTVQDIIDAIQPLARDGDIPFTVRVIALTSDGFSEQQFTGLEELLSPVFALLNARSARAKVYIEQAMRRAQTQNACANRIELKGCKPGSVTIYQAPLSGYDYALPLGWRLSRIMRYLVRAQEGDRTRCNTRVLGSIRENRPIPRDCINSIVFNDLHQSAAKF